MSLLKKRHSCIFLYFLRIIIIFQKKNFINAKLNMDQIRGFKIISLILLLLCLSLPEIGIFFVLPCIESYQKVDLRTITLGVPPQEVRKMVGLRLIAHLAEAKLSSLY